MNTENKTYKVTLDVTQQELDAAEYGSLQDMEHLASKVTEAARKEGYTPSQE